MQKCDARSFQPGSSFTADQSPAWTQLRKWALKETFVDAALIAGTAFFVGGQVYTFYNALQIYWV